MGMTWICLPVALLAAGTVLAGPAEKAYRGGDLEGAKRLYEELLHENPENLKARYNLGNVEYRAEDLRAAEEAYRLSLESDDLELRSDAAHNLGNACLLSGDLDGAIRAYQDALRARPGSPDSRYNLELALRMKQMPPPQSQEQQNQQGQSNQQDQQKQQDQQDQQEQQNQQQQQEQQEQQEQQNPEQDQSEDQQQAQQQQEQAGEQPPPESEQQTEDSAQPVPPPSPEDYSSREAERILDGLAQEERDLLEERMRAQGRDLRVEKDW
jgi:Ca-activated chloride channel family protein